ncbi:hypothetical protein M011DRAFT_31452 [Sporormia fimetaria CBS 119925]|uniref:Uncharacterized protein n=1 Tax=Sporormia fimetaria CBS 119925 TaxID=1340428 RepID=A0A6A6VFX4_9PLEO|nr:hypothetical protein M011DRAFT_31452 [Sporormia fimetaria CBS 119925]
MKCFNFCCHNSYHRVAVAGLACVLCATDKGTAWYIQTPIHRMYKVMKKSEAKKSEGHKREKAEGVSRREKHKSSIQAQDE